MDEHGDQWVRRAAVQRLESLQRAGVAQLIRIPMTSSPTLGVSEAGRIAVADDSVVASPPSVSSEVELDASLAESQAKLAIVQQEVAKCTLCNELAAARKQTVFGVGNPHARLCFLGEAPGAEEDLQGEPFVGKAGQLLTKIIEACGLKREDVYILNILKCRPPGNRNPLPQEAQNCQGFLERQLEIIQPEFICCLGSIAATNLLDTTLSIGKLRGRVHLYGDIKVVATYHPAYLLRNPSAKRQVWDDMQMLMHEMGIQIPSK